MSDNYNLQNPFNQSKINTSNFDDKCNFIFYNNLVSMNPNVLSLKDNIPQCSICLGCLTEPVKPDSCRHIFCKFCLEMWLQKKSHCPLCRCNITKISKIYFPFKPKYKNEKYNHLFFSIENLKLDNYGKFSEKCLVCGKDDNKDELLICDCCCYFQTHMQCDPPLGLSYGKYYCRFCRKKFVDSLKTNK